jgi:acyl-CoA reductase-like NAD-dependent aldehyde dehydrogenase
MEAVKEISKLEPREFTVRNPATGEDAARYPLMNKSDVDKAVNRARALFPMWSKTSFKTRRRIFKKAASILAENAERYADRISRENGKTRLDAMLADIYPVADLLKYYAKNGGKFLRPVRVSGSILLPGRKAYYRFEPKGVVGVISPWNYPFTLSAGPVISALMAGNTVVLKPASQTTDSGLMVREIFEKAGLPPDAVQVVTGSGSITGRALIENQHVDMLFFTGSTEVGREVNIQAAERLIPAVMELGGKDVAIVTKNADLDRAAAGVVWGAFTNCGQTCIGTEVILVDREVYGPFVDKVTRLTRELKTGMKPGRIGSMTMESQLKTVEEQVADAEAGGAKIITGGRRVPGVKGLFFPPTLILDTTPEMKVRTDETFGPVKPIVPFDTIDEAIEIANSTEYGLSGAVFTRDMEEGRAIARRLKTGSVNINDVLITYAYPSLPFGGAKRSGVGRYHGEMGLRAFTNVKSITEFSWPLKKELYWYPVPEESDKVAAEALKALFSRNPLKRLFAFTSLVKIISQIIKKKTRK